MKTKVFCVTTMVVLGLFGLSWAQQGSGRGRVDQVDEGDSPPPPPPPFFRGVPPLMKALDTDKDGKLSAAEIANASAALSALDTNKDGSVTEDELRPPPPDKGKPGDHLLRFDTDKDGKVSLDEFLAPPKEAFKHLDSNGDGFIDADEAAAAPPPPPPGRRPPPPGGPDGDPQDGGPRPRGHRGGGKPPQGSNAPLHGPNDSSQG